MLLAIEAATILSVGGVVTGVLGSLGALYAGIKSKQIESVKAEGERSKVGVDNTKILFDTQQSHIKLLGEAYADLATRQTETEKQLRKCQDDKSEMREMVVQVRADHASEVTRMLSEIESLRSQLGHS